MLWLLHSWMKIVLNWPNNSFDLSILDRLHCFWQIWSIPILTSILFRIQFTLINLLRYLNIIYSLFECVFTFIMLLILYLVNWSFVLKKNVWIIWFSSLYSLNYWFSSLRRNYYFCIFSIFESLDIFSFRTFSNSGSLAFLFKHFNQ